LLDYLGTKPSGLTLIENMSTTTTDLREVRKYKALGLDYLAKHSIPGVPASIQITGSNYSCGIQELAGINYFIADPSTLLRLTYFSKYPNLVGSPYSNWVNTNHYLYNEAGDLVPCPLGRLHAGSAYRAFGLRPGQAYAFSSWVERTKSFAEMIKQYSLGEVNLLPPFISKTTHQRIVLGLWIWNGNAMPVQVDPTFPYNDDGTPKATTVTGVVAEKFNQAINTIQAAVARA
jgi:hypothetical protein